MSIPFDASTNQMPGIQDLTPDEYKNGTSTFAGPPFRLGLKWDEYTPRVEARMVSDLIAMHALVSNRGLVVVCNQDEADRMLRVLDLERDEDVKTTDTWLVYQTKEDALDLPASAEYSFVVRLSGITTHEVEHDSGDQDLPLLKLGLDTTPIPRDLTRPANNYNTPENKPPPPRLPQTVRTY